MTQFTYLGIPYGHSSPEVVAHRMRSFWAATAALIKSGAEVVSPMTLEPAFVYDKTIAADWKAWQSYSLKLMSHCDRLVVLCLGGWEQSTGIAGEIEAAQRLGIAIEYRTLDFVDGFPVLKPYQPAGNTPKQTA